MGEGGEGQAAEQVLGPTQGEAVRGQGGAGRPSQETRAQAGRAPPAASAPLRPRGGGRPRPLPMAPPTAPAPLHASHRRRPSRPPPLGTAPPLRPAHPRQAPPRRAPLPRESPQSPRGCPAPSRRRLRPSAGSPAPPGGARRGEWVSLPE